MYSQKLAFGAFLGGRKRNRELKPLLAQDVLPTRREAYQRVAGTVYKMYTMLHSSNRTQGKPVTVRCIGVLTLVSRYVYSGYNRASIEHAKESVTDFGGGFDNFSEYHG